MSRQREIDGFPGGPAEGAPEGHDEQNVPDTRLRNVAGDHIRVDRLLPWR